MTWHDHFHEVFGNAIATFAFDQNLVNVAIIKIADRAFDQIAFFIDFRRRNGLQRQLADLFPQPLKIFIIALDLSFRAHGARCANDQPCPCWDVDFMSDFF